jgi:hypothetical protein
MARPGSKKVSLESLKPGFLSRQSKAVIDNLAGRASAPATRGGQGRPPHHILLVSYRHGDCPDFFYGMLGTRYHVLPHFKVGYPCM